MTKKIDPLKKDRFPVIIEGEALAALDWLQKDAGVQIPTRQSRLAALREAIQISRAVRKLKKRIKRMKKHGDRFYAKRNGDYHDITPSLRKLLDKIVG